MPTAPAIAIQCGNRPLNENDLKAPANENASAMNAEKPGKLHPWFYI